MSAAILYRGGTVYSERDLFATALLTSGDTIAWLGDAEAARPREREAERIVELNGDLLAPAFVNPLGDPDFPLSTAALVAEAAALRTPQEWPAGAVALVDPVRLLSGGEDDLDLGAVSGAGVPLALGSADPAVSPWRTVAAALRLGLSARAAFRAHTRGGGARAPPRTPWCAACWRLDRPRPSRGGGLPSSGSRWPTPPGRAGASTPARAWCRCRCCRRGTRPSGPGGLSAWTRRHRFRRHPPVWSPRHAVGVQIHGGFFAAADLRERRWPATSPA